MQDPEPFLHAQQIAPRCAVYPDSVAKVDRNHRERINYEVFYFSSDRARKRFERDPLRYCGYLTDPVTQVRFRPTKRSPRIDFEGRAFYFASDTSRKAFASAPERYALRHGR